MSRKDKLAVRQFIYIVAFILAMLIMSPILQAAVYQQIYLTPENANKSIGSTCTLSVMYDVTDNDNTLSGVGVRIHYDSSKLTYLNMTNIAPGNISTPLEKAEDPKITDRDSNTDRMIIIAWTDTGQAKWPNNPLPYKLAEINFQIKADIPSGNTKINTGITSVAAGYYGDASSASINITSMPTVAWSESALNVFENIGTINLTAQLSMISTLNDITIPLTLSGTAEQITDYNVTTQSLVIPAGQQTATVSITIVDDNIKEEDETIEVKMGSPVNALSDFPDTFVVTIKKEDEGPFTATIKPTDNTVMFFGDNFSINGELADVDDEIGVFDPDGILCGRAIIESEGVYVLTVYGDDASTQKDEGAELNDILTFKVWDLSNESESVIVDSMFKNEAVFDNEIPGAPDVPPQWTGNSHQWGLNIHLTSSQEIILHEGWNLFSFSVNKVYYDSITQPSLTTIENVDYVKVNSLNEALLTIDGKYLNIRNLDENGSKTYNPKLPSVVNTLHYLAVGYGYWIKMSEEAVLQLSGSRVDPSASLNLTSGWNLIGCWHTDLQYDSSTPPNINIPDGVQTKKVSSLKDIFSSIDSKFSNVRNLDANGSYTYNPSLPSVVNTLHYIGPGYGYWIKMKESSNFNY